MARAPLLAVTLATLICVVSFVSVHAVGQNEHFAWDFDLSLADGPPVWGGTAKWAVHVNMTDYADKSLPLWQFAYWYDASDPSAPQDRYDHGPGNGDEVCKLAAIKVGDPCTVLNTKDGTTYVLPNPSTSTCCRVVLPGKALAAILPRWLANVGATDVGKDTINGVAVDVWQAQGNYVNYYAATADGENRPVRYWEKKAGLLKQWDFLLDTFVSGDAAVPASTFAVPHACVNAPVCGK